VTRVTMREGADGVRYMKAEQPLGEHALRITDRLGHWAPSAARAQLMARRSGQALRDRALNAQRPVAILSENDLEHAMLALGCIYAGVPYCPVSPAFSTVSQDYDKLRHVPGTLTPALL